MTAARLERSYASWRQRQAAPRWNDILEKDLPQWRRAIDDAEGPRVLLATSTGGHPSAPVLDSLLGVALTLRGAQVSFLLCDAALPACKMAEIGFLPPHVLAAKGPQVNLCQDCYSYGHEIYAPLGLREHRLSHFVTDDERSEAARHAAELPAKELRSFRHDGVNIGEQALAGALRYFARSSLENESAGETILRRFLQASILTAAAVRRLIASERIDVVSVNHGIYVPQGLVAEVARQSEVRVAAWNVAYRSRSFIFSHGETYHRSLLREPVDEWESMEWSTRAETEILDYLRSRRTGGRDWIAFQDSKPMEAMDQIGGALAGFDPSRPYVGILTNVAWDAQIHYPQNAFPSMMEWLVHTIEYAGKRPDLQFVIRVHPAETRGDIPSREPSVDAIAKRLGRLPQNVFVVAPESPIGTYALMERANAVAIYGTKTGVELASLGIPVIVAGEAWIRNKGFTWDATSSENYFRLLDRLPFSKGMSPTQVTRARKYAFHFFFRRMITLASVEPSGGEPPFRIAIRRLRDLGPGKDPGLDVICDGLLTGSPFVYPAERLGIADVPSTV